MRKPELPTCRGCRGEMLGHSPIVQSSQMKLELDTELSGHSNGCSPGCRLTVVSGETPSENCPAEPSQLKVPRKKLLGKVSLLLRKRYRQSAPLPSTLFLDVSGLATCSQLGNTRDLVVGGKFHTLRMAEQ